MQSLWHIAKRSLARGTLLKSGVLLLFVIVGMTAFSPAAHAIDVGQEIMNALGAGLAGLVAGLLLLFVEAFNFLLGWIGMFFNWVVNVTVFRFSDYFGNSSGLLLAWGILRDLANMALLFGFIYIGIQTILRVDKHDAGRTLPTLIIFAVLLNFSLFAAEAVIDVANALGSTVYEQATNVDCSNSTNTETCQDQGIAAAVFQTSGLSGMLNGDQSVAEFFGALQGREMKGIVLAFALLVFVIVMIGVLVAGAIMLISRAIALMLLMITSPIGLAGAAIPGLQGFSETWWKKLIQNAAFAPVFVLLILIGLKISDGLRASFVGDQNILQVLTNTNANVGSIFVMFAVTVGFMLAALQAANYLSLFGSQAVVSRAMKFIGTASASPVLYPLGAGANAMGKVYNQQSRFWRRVTPAPLRFLVGAAGGSAVDSAIRGTLQGAQNITVPGTGMDSYSKRAAESKSRREEMRRLDKAQEGKTLWQNIRDNVGAESRAEHGERMESVENRLELRKAFSDARDGDSDKLEVALRKMKPDELRATLGKASESDLKQAATLMKSSKFKSLMEDKELNGAAKEVMKKERYGGIRRLVRDGNAKAIREKDVEDLVSAGLLDKPDTRNQLMHMVSDDQFAEIIKHPDFGGGTVQKLKNLRTGTEQGGRFGSPQAAAATLAQMSPTSRAKLPASTLAHQNVLPSLKPADFVQVAVQDQITGPPKQTVVNHVRSIANRPPGDPRRRALETHLSNLGNGERAKFRNFYGI